ncbi:MAG: NADH-quinone oxidoreductase subunit L [Chloroflexi bacterium]|nr:NADH-quinone oxidoreductase subunit L [Chloroflexota bacterium]
MLAFAWLLPALCILAFIILSFFGKRLPGKGAWVAIGAIGIGFILFWPILGELLSKQVPLDAEGRFPVFWKEVNFSLTWFEVGNYDFRLGMTVDHLAVLMLGVVTLCATLIQLYSVGYMHGDARYPWFFAVLSLFTASMLGLVLADNLLILYMAWELVGLCSYLLIGFWWEKRSAAEAAKKAFVTTRIGDVGLFIGILMLFQQAGTFDMGTIFGMVEHGEITGPYLTIAAILIFLGAMGKSGQFPLHVWLPDAMEGPTPVSALIHAATMVAAGVYLVARAFPLYAASEGAMMVIAIIGLITILISGTIAIVMTDIKKVMAYSTVGQLGYMMLSLGFGGFAAAMFHLMTHAFFKALLFLSAGSVIHGSGTQDMTELGGLRKKMKITFVTCSLGALALAGFPLFSGFWSKDEILGVVLAKGGPVFFILAAFGAFLTAFYVTRMIMMTFFGEPKHHSEHAHESPWVMTLPLVVLAFLAVTAGWLALPYVDRVFGLQASYSSIAGFLVPAGEAAEHLEFNYGLMVGSSLVALAGIFFGWLVYGKKAIRAEAVVRRFPGVHRLLVNKYYMDDLYQWMIDNLALKFGEFIAWFDKKFVSDGACDGSAGLTLYVGEKLKHHVTGKVYNYALVIVVGLIVVAIVVASLQPTVLAAGG